MTDKEIAKIITGIRDSIMPHFDRQVTQACDQIPFVIRGLLQEELDGVIRSRIRALVEKEMQQVNVTLSIMEGVR
jgi:hypothetical protein